MDLMTTDEGEILSHEYTYYLSDLRTNEVLGEIPMRSVTYSNVLSGVGDFSGSIMINHETAALLLKTFSQAGKSGLYVLRDGVVVWGGIVWKRSYSDSRELRLVGKTFESYFYHRLQHTTKYWADEDQLEMARWLVNNEEDAPEYLLRPVGFESPALRNYMLSNHTAADMLIEISSATSPERRERIMFGYEFKTVGDELERLAALVGGFDWNVRCYQDGNKVIRRKLEFYYPQAGRPLDESDLVFEFPGSIKHFSLTEDAENAGNVVWALGEGEGVESINAVADNEDDLNEGWPVLELTRSYKSVVVPSTLKRHAEADLARLRSPITVFEIEVKPDIEPEFGSYNLGDWARFRIEDLFLTPAFDKAARITGINVSVGDDTGLESIKLVLGGNEATTQDE